MIPSSLGAPSRRLSIVIIGLSITSSWGNGHATTYRALMRALAERGHDLLFLERDAPWYRAHRDLPQPPFGRTRLYETTAELKTRWSDAVRDADLVIVGSYVPDGIAVGRFVTGRAGGVSAFYDIDTPVTLAGLDGGACAYLSMDLVPAFDLYLSFTGGPVLDLLETRYGARRARALYCAVDPELYKPESAEPLWDLGYLGTYSADRQPTLDALLVAAARQSAKMRFAVVGPQYPDTIEWPANVERIAHLAPDRHRWFYARQRFTLNVTRADMVRMGYSPSVRLFEAAASGAPIISDWWPGLDSFFMPDEDILIARSSAAATHYLTKLPEDRRQAVAANARARVLASHTAAHRAASLEDYRDEVANAGQGRAALSENNASVIV
jgi:spore maturation protein CgeB